VRAARRENDGFILSVAEPHRALPALLNDVDSEGLALARLTTRHASLEDVFVSLTGRHLRDNEAESGDAERGRRGRARRGRAS
jgi:ABC-2 type transport system ATP-binding protein